MSMVPMLVMATINSEMRSELEPARAVGNQARNDKPRSICVNRLVARIGSTRSRNYIETVLEESDECI